MNQIVKNSLWEIADEINLLEEEIINSGGELTEAQESVFLKMQDLLKTKSQSCIDYMDHTKTMIDIAKKKKKEIDDYIKASQNRLESFNQYIINCMDRMGVAKIETDFLEMKVRKPTKVVHIYNEQAIPPEFSVIEQTIKINKNDLKKALKDGDIEGCELRDSPNKSLQIKMKR